MGRREEARGEEGLMRGRRERGKGDRRERGDGHCLNMSD